MNFTLMLFQSSKIYTKILSTHFFVNLNISAFQLWEHISQTKLNIGKFKLPGEDKTLVHFLENQQTQKYLLLSSHIYNKSSVPRFDRNNSVSVLEKIEQCSKQWVSFFVPR